MQRMMTLERYWQRTIKAIDEEVDIIEMSSRQLTNHLRLGQQRRNPVHLQIVAAIPTERLRRFLASLSSDKDDVNPPKIKIQGEQRRAVD